MDQDCIVITNTEIIDFFQKNNINIEEFLLGIIKPLGDFHNYTEKDVVNVMNKISTTISSEQLGLYSQINNQLFAINQNVNSFISLHKISSKKGEFMENNYYNKLTQMLPTYSIQNVSSINHAMDILIENPKLPEIRIDVKDYTQNVPLKEITKFHQDILYNKSHGILISDNSGIAGHQNFSFELIQNKYIAFYITHNNSNIDNLLNVIHFIYSIDSLLNKTDTCVLTNEQIAQINLHLTNNINYINELKNNLSNAIQLCNKLSMESISNILMISSKSQNKDFICCICKRQFTSEKRLDTHYLKCSESS